MSSSSKASSSSSTSKASSVNVFVVPHTRMKELVNSSLRRESSSSLAESSTLQSIYEAMWEFKSHEYIENTFIMDRLKSRLQARRVYNELVCNCHEDSKLLDVIDLVEQVYEARNTEDKELYAKKLYTSIQSFMEDFLHHMEEEEAIFQPLLNENFDSRELLDMNETVLRQHSLFRARVKMEKNLHKAIKRKRKEDCFDNDHKSIFQGLGNVRFKKSYCQEVADHLEIKTKDEEFNEDLDCLSNKAEREKHCTGFSDDMSADLVTSNITSIQSSSQTSIDSLPDELLLFALRNLGPRDLLRVASLSRRFYRLSLLCGLWYAIRPVQWARGIWTFERGLRDSTRFNDVRSEDSNQSFEFKVTKGLLRHVLPKMGHQVRLVSLSGAKYVSDRSISRIITLCHNVVSLDLSYTNVSQAAFRDLECSGEHLGALEELSFEGCYKVSDDLLRLLGLCFESNSKKSEKGTSKLKKLSLSGCKLVTSFGLECLDIHRKSLVFLDLSGCYRIDGYTLTEFVLGCPMLSPQSLFYCNDIEDGPHPQEANGCMNLECDQRFCCQQLLN